MLQWGRRVNTAEWACVLKWLEAWDVALQWGRRVNTAECIATLFAVASTKLASMGPPREHGGMRTRGYGVPRLPGCFNGAAA